MTEVGPADRAKLLRSKRAEQSSILTSRKRKLRELFAIATDEDGIPSFDFSNIDGPPATAAEQKFLNDCDLSLGRKFDPRLLPPYRLRSLDVLKQRVATSAVSPLKPAEAVDNGPLQPAATSTVDLQHANSTDIPLTNGVPRQVAALQVVQTNPPSTEERVIRKELQPEDGAAKTDNFTSPAQIAYVGPVPAGHHQQSLSNGADIESKGGEVGPSVHASASPVGVLGSATTPTGTEHERRSSVAGRPNGILSHARTVDEIQDGHSSHADPSRYADALSSPGSTAQSTLTTTIHEGSADTSPDHEEPLYSGKGDDDDSQKPEIGQAADNGDRADVGDSAPEAPAESSSPLPAPISGVEAQLLEESAAAQLSQTKAPSSLTAQDRVGVDSQVMGGTHGNATISSSPNVAAGRPDVDMVSKEPERPDVASTTNLPAPDLCAQGSSEPMDIDEEQVSTVAKDASRPQAEELQTLQPQLTAQEGSPSVAPVSSATPVAGRANPTIIVTDEGASNAPQSTAAAEPPALATPSPSKLSGSLPESRNDDIFASKDLSVPQLRLLANKPRDRRRKSVPTVIFGKQAKKHRLSDDTVLALSRQQPGHIPTDDYFTPLFIEGFARQSMWMKPIEKLLNQAHKTLSTSDQYVSILDHQACKILRRVYHLQQHDKWSLRQPVRCPEPTRPPSHWDVLLQEMKWMRTDFREERKWKHTIARNLAHACAEWVRSTPEGRSDLQVKAYIPPIPAVETAQPATVGSTSILDDTLPELVHSDSPMEDSTMDHDEEPLDVSIETIAPATIFALQDDEVVFGLQPSKTADELLANLPLYGSPLKVPKFDFVGSDYDPDARWRRPALPLSKYVEGEMVLDVKPPPRKRSRFRHPTDSEDEDGDEVIFGAKPDDGSQIQPATIDVALFNPEMRQARERLHASHQFRPPTEYAMPPQSFYECRTASQWTQAEDDQLRSLVREYSYNWSLISTIVSPNTLFPSGAERRTPWECFERWVQLEGLPSDMSKTPYFKIYQGRIDAAQKIIQEHNQKAQQVAPNGAVAPVPRRRPTTTVRVERRRNQKHLAMIDAMRKQAKKRESNAHKALQAANMRKTNESQAPARQQAPNKTPRDYSLMRWERDQQLAERMAQYARRNELQKRVSFSFFSCCNT
ncbi:hypothetical protein B0T16DRAFT_153476 [Cercophora newfieldiana]|uniref:Vacuolar import and degradation protein 21 n=1 Tax=Cercophora newfieldiana TaxID=92897 RepID=A0AA40CP53_9PEZI|nr:hypothetical protein B0T16DRAFT_153476 [Cercophora newfieldiana]